MEPCSSRLRIPTRDGALFIEYHEILQLKAEGSYSKLYCEHGLVHLISMNLHELEEKLPTHHFFRCHHSNMVNLTKVKQVFKHNGHRVLLVTGETIQVSRRKWAALVAAMENL